MTRAELRNLTLYWLDDLAGGYFTETQVNTWINNAQKVVQDRLIKSGQLYFLKCVQTTLVQNQSNYALPADLKKVNRLEVVIAGTVPNETKSPIIPITLMQQDLVQNGTGTPQCYYLTKNEIIVLPAPDSPLTMRLDYTYQISDLTDDSEVPDLPDAYHELIALLAAQDGFIKDGRTSELLVKKIKEFEDQFDADAQERNQDVPRNVVITGSGGAGEFFW